MNKIAIIHLYCNGYSGEDLLDFNLKLSSSSTIAQLQKLELIRSRFETAGSVLGTTNIVDRLWVQKNVLRLTDDEIDAINKGLEKDKKLDLQLEATQLDTDEGEDPGQPDLGMDFGGDTPPPPPPDTPDETPAAEAGGEPIAELTDTLSINDIDAPIKVANNVSKLTAILSEDDDKKDLEDKLKEKNRKRQVRKRRGVDELPMDYADSNDDLTGGLKRDRGDLNQTWRLKKSDFKPDLFEQSEDDFNLNEYLDNKIEKNAQITGRIQSALRSLDDHINSKPHVISEKRNSSGEKK